jgi:flagellar biosynthetic protein FlhB
VPREANHWFIILGNTISVMVLAPMVMMDLSDLLLKFIEQPHAIALDQAAFPKVINDLMLGAILAVLPVLLLLMLVAFAARAVQDGFISSTEKIKQKLDKISPRIRFKRPFSVKPVVELLKGSAKLSIVAAVCVGVLSPHFAVFESLPTMEIADCVNVMYRLSIRLIVGVLAIVLLIAVLDFLFQRLRHSNETKQSEGGPQRRGGLRQTRRERAQRRMMQSVPKASVVVASPTHFCGRPEIRYECAKPCRERRRSCRRQNSRDRGRARHPDCREPSLARALFAGVEIGEEIPTKHYEAVAEIIGYVLRLNGKLLRPARRLGAL